MSIKKRLISEIENMKKVFYKISLVFAVIVIGFVFLIGIFVKDVYFSRLTEDEAAKTLFHYINFGCDYNYDSMVNSAAVQGQAVYLYQTPGQKNEQYEMLQCKKLTNDERYYIFSYYTQYETDALSQGFYYEYHTDYAVNRVTGEVIIERQWLKKGKSYEVVYNEEYEKEIIQTYFNEDISDGKMTEEEAAEALFYYLYPTDQYDYDYDLMVAKTIQQKQSTYVYQLPEELPCTKHFCCTGLTEDKQYYIFAYYTTCYTYSYGPMFICNQYHASYAVNRETGEVLQEREWNDMEREWSYNDEYKKVVGQKSVIQLYYEFLDGNCEIEGRSINDIIVPTGEPPRRYETDYIIFDSNGDDMPELHIRNAREFLIFSYRDDELFVFQSSFSEPWNIHLLENGAFIFNTDRGGTTGEYYRYFELDTEGNKTNEIEFSWDDVNEDCISDEKDQYVFDGNVCSMKEWYEWTEEYIYVDEEGRNQLCNEAEWKIYCRER